MYNTNILREVRYLIPQTISEWYFLGVKKQFIPQTVRLLLSFGISSKIAFTRDGGIGARPAGYSRLSQDAPVPPSLLNASLELGGEYA